MIRQFFSALHGLHPMPGAGWSGDSVRGYSIVLAPLIVCLGFGIPSPSPATRAELEVVDVCQALKKAHESKGTLIGIKAVMQGGSEGSWLEGECGGVFRSRHGFVWPDMVSLSLSPIPGPNRGRPHGHEI